jgi:hypothetical protein
MELPIRPSGVATETTQQETNVRLEAIIRELQRTNELLAGIVTELRIRPTISHDTLMTHPDSGQDDRAR